MRLMLADIDGTILPEGATQVSERTRLAFHAALDAGHVAGISSGRGYAWIPGFFGGDTRPCATTVATNGMQVYHEGELILEKTLPRELLVHMAELVRAWPHAGLLCFDELTPLLTEGSIDDLRLTFPSYAEVCKAVDDVPAIPVVKANVFVSGGDAVHREFVEMLNRELPELDVDLARPGYSNVMLHGWNKGTAVVYLRDYLGIAPEDVFVFGDADNDLPMFRVVENSVAVSGATPEAASAARWHIGACEDDAVAAAIEALARGEFPFSE